MGLLRACCRPRTRHDGEETSHATNNGGQHHVKAGQNGVHHEAPTQLRVQAVTDTGLTVQTSITLSDADVEFASCRDDFSVTDGAHLDTYSSVPTSPFHSTPLPHTPGQHAHEHHLHPAGHFLQPQAHEPGGPEHQPHVSAGGNWQQADEVFQMSETDSELLESSAGVDSNSKRLGFAGCLHILDNINIGPSKHQEEPRLRPTSMGRRHGEKPPAGCSLMPRDKTKSALDVSFCWEDASSSVFQIRREDYMKSKVKEPSQPAMYQLAAADIFAFPKKQNHIARLVQLPAAGPPVMAGDVALPPILIFNLQMPLYPAPIFGPYDGEGVSIVLYFKLPDGFNPAAFGNQKALELYKRFLTNSREADGSLTRDRLKMIPRVVNVEEWVKKGPLSQAEAKLLTTYNDKPILTRPQHLFYQGRGYFEVDLDLHQYTYLARRAIGSYLSRLPHVVWEVGFVVQGNAPGELPEHLLGVSRIYRFDFAQAKPLPMTRPVTADGTPAPDTPHTTTVSLLPPSPAVWAAGQGAPEA